MLLGPADVLVLSGADARTFAHAQFTSDVAGLAPGAWHWSAWLDAAGRVRHFFALLHPDPDRFVAWLPLGGAEAMQAALARYVLRAKVAFERPQGWAVHRLDAAGAIPTPAQIAQRAGGFAIALPGETPRVAGLARAGDGVADPAALTRWRRQDVAVRLPLLPPELAGEFVPQALDLEAFDAIRFDKGCYPGQEVAARLHFRGGNKRHLHRTRIAGTAAAGTRVLRADGGAAGTVLYASPNDAAGCDALAVLAVLADGSEAQRLATADGDAVELVD